MKRKIDTKVKNAYRFHRFGTVNGYEFCICFDMEWYNGSVRKTSFKEVDFFIKRGDTYKRTSNICKDISAFGGLFSHSDVSVYGLEDYLNEDDMIQLLWDALKEFRVFFYDYSLDYKNGLTIRDICQDFIMDIRKGVVAERIPENYRYLMKKS